MAAKGLMIRMLRFTALLFIGLMIGTHYCDYVSGLTNASTQRGRMKAGGSNWGQSAVDVVWQDEYEVAAQAGPGQAENNRFPLPR